jgi:phosphoglycerol transferase MdoB-like AlkP superfamily enzyme
MLSRGSGVHHGRARLLVLLFAVLLLVSTATRLALIGHERLWSDAPELVARGLALDAAVAVLLLAPLALALALSGGAWIRRAGFRTVLVTAFAASAVFGAFVEYFFFEEFDARFNHVALDYLISPREVAGNVWESYPVVLYAAIALLAGGSAAWLVERGVRASGFVRHGWRGRLVRAALVGAAATTAVFALVQLPSPSTADRRADEVASNGIVQLARALQTASLDYESYYATVTPDVRARVAREELGWPAPDDPVRNFTAVERPAQPLDIVVVLGESFGSEFVGRLGGKRPCTPGLERWAERGLFLSNVVPTGNRTVRGLEGVLCSFVPLPGDSVWKRDTAGGVASVAQVVHDQGYRTEFVYGGDGAFDHMQSFALQNGWDAFHDDSLVGTSSFPRDAFRTIWGVADETMFAKLLERQRQARDDGTPLFATALTVSNHKPFLTPDNRSSRLRWDKIRSCGIIGAGLLLASLLGWRWFAPHARGVAVGVLIVAWGAFLVYSWTKAQPRGTRESAVRYADRALADYLDRAEAEGLLDHTVVLFVGDHGARVYGSEQIPAASYRVPALFVCPGEKYDGVTISRLCSQVDLAPTLLSLAGVDCAAPFFGRDLLQEPFDGPGRAFLIHNRDIGLLTDTTLTVLGLRKTVTCYRRSGRSSDVFQPVDCSGDTAPNVERAAAVFECASRVYQAGRYRVDDGS